jgi:tetratricopeptide (TPR) repeat protein
MAWASVLLPQAQEDYTAVVVLGERAVAGAELPGDRANALNTLGVALYRAGRYTEALTKLEESERAKPERMNTVFIALCQHALGQHPRAQSLADSYYNFIRDSLPVGSFNRAEYLLFEKELRAAVPPSKKANPL